MDIFEILGPVMVGPSSSHTAGAARIGSMARTLLGSTPVKAAICTAPLPTPDWATAPTVRWWPDCWA